MFHEFYDMEFFQMRVCGESHSLLACVIYNKFCFTVDRGSPHCCLFGMLGSRIHGLGGDSEFSTSFFLWLQLLG